MAYIDREYYQSLYGDIPEADFNRLSWETSRKMDVATTGIDGVKKLKVAFPTDEDDSEAVKRCACALVDILYQIKQAEETAKSASGYTETVNGLQGKVISSVTSGNESISFSTSGSAGIKTRIDEAMSDGEKLTQLIDGTIRDYLSGISDANGVNLLFMGQYPCRRDAGCTKM